MNYLPLCISVVALAISIGCVAVQIIVSRRIERLTRNKDHL